MPVWHDAMKSARKNGQVVMLGVIQEQHPERCRLYAQWQQLDWPIVSDPINQLDLAGVPIVVEIDPAESRPQLTQGRHGARAVGQPAAAGTVQAVVRKRAGAADHS